MLRARALLIVVTTLALAGCGIVPGLGPDPRVEAVPVDEVVCPETYEEGHAEAGLVPSGFDAVAVVRCDPYASLDDTTGTWSGVQRTRLVGDLAPVLDALATPADPRSTWVCPAIGYVMPEIWIESADGAFVRAAVPTTGCGEPKVDLGAVLSLLEVEDETFSPSALVESDEASAAGCQTQAGVLALVAVAP